MCQYIIRRILQMIPVLFGVSIIIYMIFALAPGDVVTNMLQTNPNISEEHQAQLRHIYHLDEPKVVQYGYWLSNAIKGNMGDSYKYKQPVIEVINAHIWYSLTLDLSSLLASIVIAIPIGVISATKQYSIFDKVFTVFAIAGISIPSFFLAMLLIKWLAVTLQWFPVGGVQETGSIAQGFSLLLDRLHHMVLPFTVLTIIHVAVFMRYTRTSMLEVIRLDFIRTARAKGLKEKYVVYKHALRNALIPVITLFGLSLPALFSGALITEQIFMWPGMGPVTVYAVNNRDYPLLMGIMMLLSLLTLVGNLVADVLYALVDPRIRLK